MGELFGVNVRGPDDIIATRDYPEAVALASLINYGLATHVAHAHHELDPLTWAIPGVWQGSAEAHARDLATPSLDYYPGLLQVRGDAAALHNKLAGAIASQIVRAPLTTGGKIEDVMILTESVIVGVALACIRLGGDEKVLDLMVGSAKQRLASIRLKDAPTAGRG